MTKCVTVLRPVPGRDSSANAAPIMVTAAHTALWEGACAPGSTPVLTLTWCVHGFLSLFRMVIFSNCLNSVKAGPMSCLSFYSQRPPHRQDE